MPLQCWSREEEASRKAGDDVIVCISLGGKRGYGRVFVYVIRVIKGRYGIREMGDRLERRYDNIEGI